MKIDTMTGAALAFAGFAVWFINRPKRASELAQKTALLSNAGPGFSTLDAQDKEVQTAADTYNGMYVNTNMQGKL